MFGKQTTPKTETPKVTPRVEKPTPKKYPEGSWTGKDGDEYIMENGEPKKIS